MSKKMGLFVFRSDQSEQKISAILPIVDVVNTLIMNGDRILAVYNHGWGSFTLPSTKRRTWEDGNAAKGAVREEEWEDAAIRAAAEWLGQTVTSTPTFLADVPEFQQSDRDGKWKRYRLKAYRLEVNGTSASRGTGPMEWLTADQFMDPDRRPISPTARHVVAELQASGRL